MAAAMSTAMPSETFDEKRLLAGPVMRRMLEDFVRRRVPSSDVDDVVQTVLVEALASPARPHEEQELRRWLVGIAKHKVVDHHRKRSRETATDLPDVPVGPAPVEARSLAQWAEQQAGPSSDAQSTLEWMAREGEGEKLEAIAAEEKLPAARVRQRASRMRRWMKERWLAELAAAAALAIAAFVLWRIFRKEEPITQPTPERPAPSVSPDAPAPERARALRDRAFEACERSAWQECLDRLDEAKGLDPEGDSEPRAAAARAAATEALRTKAPAPTTDPTTTPAPIQQKPAPTSAPAPPKPPAPVQTGPRPTEKKAPPVKQPPSKSKFSKDADWGVKK